MVGTPSVDGGLKNPETPFHASLAAPVTQAHAPVAVSETQPEVSSQACEAQFDASSAVWLNHPPIESQTDLDSYSSDCMQRKA